MTDTSIDKLLMIVRIIDFCMRDDKKLFVHCHAGRGRTGMVICCVLVYKYRLEGTEAIKLFQQNRENRALDSKKQQTSVLEFEQCTSLVIKT